MFPKKKDMCFCMKSLGKCLTHRDTYNIINQYDDERNRMLQSPGGFWFR